jgi:hypothetical protein
LRKSAGAAVPIAVRTLEFPRGEACNNAVAKLLKSGGRRAYVDAPTLRALVAFQRFQPAFPDARVAAWRRRDQPISKLPPMAHIFDLERLRPAPTADTATASTTAPATPSISADPAAAASALITARPATGSVSPESGRLTSGRPNGGLPRDGASAAIGGMNGGAHGGSNGGTHGGSTAHHGAVSARSSSPARPADTASPTTDATARPAVATPSLPERACGGGDLEAAAFGSAATILAPFAAAAAHTSSAVVPAAPPIPTRTPSGFAPPPASAQPRLLNVGTGSGFRAEARTIEVSSLLRHTGILGSPGSGKTTLALNLIEQVLERDVAVVLVDRKGDLAGYAKRDWWQGTSDPERARRLAERIDVRLFTPGTRGGRPLSLSVVPELDRIPEHERDRMVQYAANALAAMMRISDAGNGSARRAILTQAISLLAGRRGSGGLPELIAMLEDRDDELIDRAGRYDDKLFRRLVQDLETVRLSDADLFDPTAEPLVAETLLGRGASGKVPLTIVSTRFLGDVERIQSWVAHLIACLSRHAARAPSAELRTIFMIDEADVFMPAGAAKPPSKEPLQDLLKRARAAGLGVVLASQSPADLDYRSREQINTWFLGRIADKRSIEKMKPLFEHRPIVGSKLGTLEAGRFVLLQDGGAADLERTPSLLRTEQLSEDELMELAARDRPRC